MRLKKKYTISKDVHKEIQTNLDYSKWSKLMEDCNKMKAAEVVEKNNGTLLPCNIGYIILLLAEPKKHVKEIYSATNKGKSKVLYNFHTFGKVGKVFWKKIEKMPFYFYLWKFKPNRPNIKVPIYNKLNSSNYNYFDKHEFYL